MLRRAVAGRRKVARTGRLRSPLGGDVVKLFHGVRELNDPETSASLEDTLRAEAQKAARRTLRHRFGRLSNRRIIATLRATADAAAYLEESDQVLLDRWFAEYEIALRGLRAGQNNEAGPSPDA